jgi:hypothetical protein
MANPYRGGTADVWYDGAKDLWVEYKFMPKVPKRGTILADLSALQLRWLRGRYDNGRHVAVILGSPIGGVVLEHLTWEHALTPDEFANVVKTKQELAAWIIAAVAGEPL